MDPRELQLLKDTSDSAPSGKSDKRKGKKLKVKPRRFQDSQ